MSKNSSQKKAGRVAQDVGPKFKPQYLKNKRKKIPNTKRDWQSGSSDRVPA
jgi:hypothetical protein